MPDEDEVPVVEMIAPKTYKDLQRALSNDALYRQQIKAAAQAATPSPSQQVTAAIAALTSALNGTGTVSSGCQTAGAGPIYISLSLLQATALVTKLTGGLL